ncbi:MAG: SpoIIIAH-like family protein [Bacillota bacterium]|nr:SpoIIIAH-like family protein [Bacillota bacterium]
MNKKQAGIIVTLLALIVCAGILAAKVNGPLGVTNDDFNNDGIVTMNNDKNSTTTSTEYFESSRTKKEQIETQAMASLRTIIDDKNVTEAQRNEATKQYTQYTVAQTHEQKIEEVLKGKGFDDVICYLEDNNQKARIVIKAKDLTTQQGKVIKDVVYSEAKIINVEVECKE